MDSGELCLQCTADGYMTARTRDWPEIFSTGYVAFSAWVKIINRTVYHPVFGIDHSGGAGNYAELYSQITNGGILQIGGYSGGGNVISGSTEMLQDVLYCIGGVWAATPNAALYVNGRPETITPGGTPGLFYDSGPSPLTLFRLLWSSYGFSRLKIHSFQMWNRALTANEFLELYLYPYGTDARPRLITQGARRFGVPAAAPPVQFLNPGDLTFLPIRHGSVHSGLGAGAIRRVR